MAVTITVRRLINGEPSYGSSADFLTDGEAVGQIILTSLNLLQGEWWEDQSIGLPLFQKILQSGAPQNQQAALLVIQQQILAVPYVTGLGDISTSFNGQTRGFTFSCDVQTQFGPLTITNAS